MKKLIALLLAILMVATVALVSCNDKKGTTGNNNGGDVNVDNDDDNGLVIPDDFGSSDTTGTGTDSTETSDDSSNNETPSADFVDVTSQFSVYTYVTTKIRASAKMNSGEVTNVEASAQLTVIAKNDEWYKVKVGSDEGYVPQDFVTANKEDTMFTDFEETDYKSVQIKGDAENENRVNIRQYPIISDDYLVQEIETLTYAETSNNELLKIGENASGTWYKVSYNNGVYYLKVNSSTKPLLIVDGQPLDSSQGGI